MPCRIEDNYETILRWLNAQGCVFKRSSQSPCGFGWISREEAFLSATATEAYSVLVEKRISDFMNLNMNRFGTDMDALVRHTAQRFNKPEWYEDPEHSIWKIALEVFRPAQKA